MFRVYLYQYLQCVFMIISYIYNILFCFFSVASYYYC